MSHFHDILSLLTERVIETEKSIEIFILSDLHSDYPSNYEWLRKICHKNQRIEREEIRGNQGSEESGERRENKVEGDENGMTGMMEREVPQKREVMKILICSGDITHDITLLKDVFLIMKEGYDEVRNQ